MALYPSPTNNNTAGSSLAESAPNRVSWKLLKSNIKIQFWKFVNFFDSMNFEFCTTLKIIIIISFTLQHESERTIFLSIHRVEEDQEQNSLFIKTTRQTFLSPRRFQITSFWFYNWKYKNIWKHIWIMIKLIFRATFNGLYLPPLLGGKIRE